MTFFTKKYLPFLIVFLLSFFVIRPLFMEGFFPVHDSTQVERVFEMSKALRDGMFPVRWVADLGYGYGYPIFNFYAPLAYYAGAFINLLGFDPLLSTKIMIGFPLIFSGVAMYLLARDFWGKIGGIISGVFYLYAPYHALDTYVRGDVGELWAYAFIPLCFYGAWKIYKKLSFSNIALFSLSFAAIILSHNLTAFMITPFLLCFIIFLCLLSERERKKTVAISLLFTFILGIGIAAFYWIPALFEMKFTNISYI